MSEPRPLARGPPLRCGVCGSRRVMAVLPGSEPVVEFGITLSRGVAQLAWCRRCWPMLAAVRAPLAGSREVLPHVPVRLQCGPSRGRRPQHHPANDAPGTHSPMRQSARNQVASARNDAIVTAPETAKAPRREPQSLLCSTNEVVASPECTLAGAHDDAAKASMQGACL